MGPKHSKLDEIVAGTLVKDEWTTFLKKIKFLGSGKFGIVNLAEDPFDRK